MILTIMRDIGDKVLHTKQFSSQAGDSLLCLAVWIGQYEKRPMTAAKLSTYIGMPRPTVIRRLREMQERGRLSVTPRGEWFVPDSSDNYAVIAELLQTNMRHFEEACAKVSKMDTKKVAVKRRAK